MTRIVFLIIVITCLSFNVSFGVEYSDDVAKWISVPLPQIEEGEVSIPAAWSDHEWQVYLDKESGSVRVKPYDPDQRNGEKPDFKITKSKEMYGEEYIFKVADGWLIGFNGGEWGGSLWWFSENGKESYKISDDQIRGYIQRGDTLFAIEGLAHLLISEGKVIEIIKNDKTGKYESVTHSVLPEAPDAVTLDKDGSLIIVTTSSLIKVSLDGKAEKLVEGTFWNSLYSNSVVIDSQHNIYIGMRQGITKVSLLSGFKPKIEWLVPSNTYWNEEIKNYKRTRDS